MSSIFFTRGSAKKRLLKGRLFFNTSLFSSMIVNHIWIQFHSIGQTPIVILVAFSFMGYNIFLGEHILHLILCNNSFDQSLQPIFGSNSIQIGQTAEVQDSKYFLHSCICTLYIFFEKTAYF